MAPKPRRETLTPVLPKSTYCITHLQDLFQTNVISIIIENFSIEECYDELPKRYFIATEIGQQIIEEAKMQKYDDLKSARELLEERRDTSSVASYNAIMQSESIDRKEWRYTGDYRNESKHCRNHVNMDGQLVLKGEPFTLVGLDGITYYPMHPRDPSLPMQERANCLCILQGITKDSILGIPYKKHN